MKNIKYSTQAKKDLKRFLLFPDKLKKLYSILKLLQEERPLPEEVKKHVLQGNLSGFLIKDISQGINVLEYVWSEHVHHVLHAASLLLKAWVYVKIQGCGDVGVT